MIRSILLATAILLGGCAFSPFAGFDIAPGTPRDAVLARLGAPTQAVRTASGERLIYSSQPVGRQAWAVDLDATGRVVRATQVLTQQNFGRIQPGWTVDDVTREFGRPAWVDRVASWNGPVWTYRWRDNVNADMFYWVYFDPAGIVRRAHPGMEFFNAPNDRN